MMAAHTQYGEHHSLYRREGSTGASSVGLTRASASAAAVATAAMSS